MEEAKMEVLDGVADEYILRWLRTHFHGPVIHLYGASKELAIMICYLLSLQDLSSFLKAITDPEQKVVPDFEYFSQLNRHDFTKLRSVLSVERKSLVEQLKDREIQEELKLLMEALIELDTEGLCVWTKAAKVLKSTIVFHEIIGTTRRKTVYQSGNSGYIMKLVLFQKDADEYYLIPLMYEHRFKNDKRHFIKESLNKLLPVLEGVALNAKKMPHRHKFLCGWREVLENVRCFTSVKPPNSHLSKSIELQKQLKHLPVSYQIKSLKLLEKRDAINRKPPSSITLGCGHEYAVSNFQDIDPRLSIMCPSPNCSHVLTDSEENKIIRKCVEGKLPKVHCIFGLDHKQNIRIHSNHYICKKCSEKYFGNLGRGGNTCPAKYCKYRLVEQPIGNEFFEVISSGIEKIFDTNVNDEGLFDDYEKGTN